MNELLEFLDKRVEFLRGFDDDTDDLNLDGEEIYEAGIEQGRFVEAIFIRDKIKNMMPK